MGFDLSRGFRKKFATFFLISATRQLLALFLCLDLESTLTTQPLCHIVGLLGFVFPLGRQSATVSVCHRPWLLSPPEVPLLTVIIIPHFAVFVKTFFSSFLTFFCFVVGIIHHYFSEVALVHTCIPQTYTPCGQKQEPWLKGEVLHRSRGLPSSGRFP